MKNNEDNLDSLVGKLQGGQKEDIEFLQNLHTASREAEEEVLRKAKESKEKTQKALEKMSEPGVADVLNAFDSFEDTWVVDGIGTVVNRRPMKVSTVKKRELRRRYRRRTFETWGGWERVLGSPYLWMLVSILSWAGFLAAPEPQAGSPLQFLLIAALLPMGLGPVLTLGMTVLRDGYGPETPSWSEAKWKAEEEDMTSRRGIPPWDKWRDSGKESKEVLKSKAGKNSLTSLGAGVA